MAAFMESNRSIDIGKGAGLATQNHGAIGDNIGNILSFARLAGKVGAGTSVLGSTA